jgi:TonB family protein
VQFVVERDGSASNVKISNSDPETKLLEEEAVRLVQGMPPWKSAKVDGKKVRSHLRVPISFTLD